MHHGPSGMSRCIFYTPTSTVNHWVCLSLKEDTPLTTLSNDAVSAPSICTKEQTAGLMSHKNQQYLSYIDNCPKPKSLEKSSQCCDWDPVWYYGIMDLMARLISHVYTSRFVQNNYKTISEKLKIFPKNAFTFLLILFTAGPQLSNQNPCVGLKPSSKGGPHMPSQGNSILSSKK